MDNKGTAMRGGPEGPSVAEQRLADLLRLIGYCKQWAERDGKTRHVYDTPPGPIALDHHPIALTREWGVMTYLFSIGPDGQRIASEDAKKGDL